MLSFNLSVYCDLFLQEIYEHCKESAGEQLSKIEEDMFLPPLENPALISPDSNGTDHQPKSPPPSKAQSASRVGYMLLLTRGFSLKIYYRHF